MGMFTYYVEHAYVPPGTPYSDAELLKMIETEWETYRTNEMKMRIGSYRLVFAADCIQRKQEIVMTDVDEKIEEISETLKNWRQNNGIPEGQELTGAQRNSLIDFTYTCIDEMGYDLPADRSNATVIPYTGATEVNGITKNNWEIVDTITKQSPDKYMYISDTPAGKFINRLYSPDTSMTPSI